MYACKEEGKFDLIGVTAVVSMNSLYKGHDMFSPGLLRPSELEMVLDKKGVEIVPQSRVIIKKENGTRKRSRMCNENGIFDPDDYASVISYDLFLRRGRDSANVTIMPVKRSKQSLYETITITLNTNPQKDETPHTFVHDVLDAIMKAYDGCRAHNNTR